MAPVSHLAGHHRGGIHGLGLCLPHGENSLPALPFFVQDRPSTFRTMAHGASQSRTLRRLLHPQRFVVPFVACQLSPAEHEVVPAMGNIGLLRHRAGVCS